MPIMLKDQKRILFIHIPKTGGSSIEQYFEQNGWTFTFHRNDVAGEATHCSAQHFHADPLKTLFSLDRFDYIFTVVRDPWERFQSELKWQAKVAGQPLTEAFALSLLDGYYRNPYFADNHIRPQSEFIAPGTDVHNFAYAFHTIPLKLKVLFPGMFPVSDVVGRVNDSDGVTLPPLSDRLKSKVLRLYRKDVRLLANIR